MLNKNERMEMLRANGVDTSKYFTLIVNEDIPAGTKINISIDREENNPIVNQIVEDGYVKNTKLHRRFVAAQYMRMLNSRHGYHGYLNLYYGYMYQFDMMLEEVRVLSILEKKDREVFMERSRFFTLNVIRAVMDDYFYAVKSHIKGLKIRHCKGEPYVNVAGFGNVFTADIDKKIINPLEAAISNLVCCHTYKDMYQRLSMVKQFMIALPYGTKKSKVWVDAFQKEGAFYTLKNLIMFHNVGLYYNGNYYHMYTGMHLLDKLLNIHRYEGYQLNAVLKKTIEKNQFDFAKSCAAHR